jgi:hypothetical protein
MARIQEQTDVPNESGSGIASWLHYRFSNRWAALYRFDNLKIKDSFDVTSLPNDTQERHSAGLVFMPSKFSSFKLEYNQRKSEIPNAQGEKTENTIFLQGNFTVGGSDAHSH